MAKGTELRQLAPVSLFSGKDSVSCGMKELGERRQIGGHAAPRSALVA